MYVSCSTHRRDEKYIKILFLTAKRTLERPRSRHEDNIIKVGVEIWDVSM
jgi:hypothetical protein